MKVIAELARAKSVCIPIIVGGAVVTKSYADEIGALYGKNAVEVVGKILK